MGLSPEHRELMPKRQIFEQKQAPGLEARKQRAENAKTTTVMTEEVSRRISKNQPLRWAYEILPHP